MCWAEKPIALCVIDHTHKAPQTVAINSAKKHKLVSPKGSHDWTPNKTSFGVMQTSSAPSRTQMKYLPSSNCPKHVLNVRTWDSMSDTRAVVCAASTALSTFFFVFFHLDRPTNPDCIFSHTHTQAPHTPKPHQGHQTIPPRQPWHRPCERCTDVPKVWASRRRGRTPASSFGSA